MAFLRNIFKSIEKGKSTMKEVDMKSTENIESVEEREELLEKKEDIIRGINSWYEDCYSYIWGLSRDNSYHAKCELEKAWKLVGYAHDGDDQRDENVTIIHESICQYFEKQSLECFKGIDDSYDMFDLMLIARLILNLLIFLPGEKKSLMQ